MGTVLQEPKQRDLAKVVEIERYNERVQQYKQNRLFTIDQKKLFAESNRKTKESNEIPDADQSRVFWSGIWSESKRQNRNAEWLKRLKVENNYQKQECPVITKKMVSKQSRKIPNWKERDGVQGFWIKKLTNLHEGTAFQLNKILNENQQLSDWLTYGRTVLCHKDRTKGNAVDNYRPISCLPLMWKLLTGIISKHLYIFCKKRRYYPKNKKVVKEIAEELKIRY